MDMVVAGRPHRLITLAAFMVVSFGLSKGQLVVVPVVLTVFIIIVAAPFYQGLQRRGLPAWAARALVMVGVLIVMSALFLIGAAVLRGLSVRMPLYEARYGEARAALDALLAHHTAIGKTFVGLVPSPQQLAAFLQQGLQTLLAHAWPAWLLVFLVQDALEDADALPKMVRQYLPSGPRLWENWQRSAGYVRRYMALRSLEGLVKGTFVFGAAWLLGIEFPLAWALVAFLTTFLPQAIGQPLAMLGPALMAMIGPGAWIAVGYVVGYPILEWACDEIFEPYLDASVRISDFQSGVAVFYWTLVLGPLGAFMAVPLTVMVRAFLASFEESWPMAVLMYQESDQPQGASLPEGRP